ncbi:hypothetical protein ACIG5E_33825 [Kitasatospora sp. NPDC053057]|uniref:hypothetical protein n=1 Tax=Kitasatospora sp. NPDC053057 TaxID=3364062 RepID=UPI0037CB1DDD
MTSAHAAERYAELTRDHEERAQLADPATRPPADQLLDPATGTIAIGRYADGTQARASLWNTDGAAHCQIAAETGAGSSTLIDHLLAAEHASDLTQSWAASRYGIRPGLADRTTTTRGETVDLLRDAVALMHERLAAGADTAGPYAPTPERPLISITLGHGSYSSASCMEAAYLANEIATTGRLAGIALRAEGKGALPSSIPLPLRLSHAQVIVLGFRSMPGRGLIAENRIVSGRTFRTWAPTEQ